MLLGSCSANMVRKELDAICIILKTKWWRCQRMEKQTNQSNTDIAQMFSHINSAEIWELKTNSSPLVAYYAPRKAYLTSGFTATYYDKWQRALSHTLDLQVPPSCNNHSKTWCILKQHPHRAAGDADKHRHARLRSHFSRKHSHCSGQRLSSRFITPCRRRREQKKALWWSLLTNTGLPGKRIASIVMETASALTVVPPWEVNTAWMVVTLNDPLCTLINICLREKHKPARKLISFDTNALGLFFVVVRCFFIIIVFNLPLIDRLRFIMVPNNRHLKHDSHNNKIEQLHLMEFATHQPFVYTVNCLKMQTCRFFLSFVFNSELNLSVHIKHRRAGSPVVAGSWNNPALQTACPSCDICSYRALKVLRALCKQ